MDGMKRISQEMKNIKNAGLSESVEKRSAQRWRIKLAKIRYLQRLKLPETVRKKLNIMKRRVFQYKHPKRYVPDLII